MWLRCLKEKSPQIEMEISTDLELDV